MGKREDKSHDENNNNLDFKVRVDTLSDGLKILLLIFLPVGIAGLIFFGLLKVLEAWSLTANSCALELFREAGGALFFVTSVITIVLVLRLISSRQKKRDRFSRSRRDND